ncbi:YdcF family protein [filamentous cyanobacterium CCP3]|nr:YdcF family protein [filamentous cyanobacterium CCP3]
MAIYLNWVKFSMPDLTNIWTTFTRTVFLSASSPRFVTPALLAISALALVPRIPLWSKCVGRLMALLLAIYLLLATPLAASVLMKGLSLFLQPYAGESADAVVVLSRGKELGFSRYDLAIDLWQQGRVSKIFVTNLGRISYVADQFKQANLPLSALVGSTCARTTYEEAISAGTLLQPQQIENIVLITDPAHMWRSVLTFRRLGFTLWPLLSSYPPDLSALDRSVLALREYLGLVHYAILGRLAPSTGQDLAEALANQLGLTNCTVRWLSKVQIDVGT